MNQENGVYFYNDNTHHKYNYPKRYKHLILNYEDNLFVAGMPSNITTIVVLRDFLNLLSSTMHHSMIKDKSTVGQIISRWKIFALCGMGISRTAFSDTKHLIVIYNRWLLSREYRDEISRLLNIDNIHDNTSSGDHPGWSSFSKDMVEPDKEAYLRRYKHLTLTKQDVDLIKSDSLLCYLNKLLFDMDVIEQLKEISL